MGCGMHPPPPKKSITFGKMARSLCQFAIFQVLEFSHPNANSKFFPPIVFTILVSGLERTRQGNTVWKTSGNILQTH